MNSSPADAEATPRPEICRLCRSCGPHRHLLARELMFGTGTPFDYFECNACGSLQIGAAPPDLSPFYPAHYYSYTANVDTTATPGPLRRWARAQRAAALCGRGTAAGSLLNAVSSDYSKVNWTWMRKLQATPTSRLIDVGCGSGVFLRQLRLAGFQHLYGADPFLRHSIASEGVTIFNRSLADIDGQFNAITFHHSLEHMFDPIAALAGAREKLSPNGRVLVRIPVAGCRAWHEYGANWCQLDAPRHLTIPSVEGLTRAARVAGLVVSSIEFDSYNFQFWGSEMYKRGLPLIGADGTPTLRQNPLFTDTEMVEFTRQSEALNAAGEGDQACFYLAAA